MVPNTASDWSTWMEFRRIHSMASVCMADDPKKTCNLRGINHDHHPTFLRRMVSLSFSSVLLRSTSTLAMSKENELRFRVSSNHLWCKQCDIDPTFSSMDEKPMRHVRIQSSIALGCWPVECQLRDCMHIIMMPPFQIFMKDLG